MLPEVMDGKTAETLTDITDTLLALGPAKRLYVELVKLVVLMLLIMSVTAESSESSFSAIRRLKNYLRSKIGQERLKNVILYSIFMINTLINLCDMARDFIALNENRRSVFWRILNSFRPISVD